MGTTLLSECVQHHVDDNLGLANRLTETLPRSPHIAGIFCVIAKLRFFSQSQKWLYYCHHLLPCEAIRADDIQPLFNPDGITPVQGR